MRFSSIASALAITMVLSNTAIAQEAPTEETEAAVVEAVEAVEASTLAVEQVAADVVDVAAEAAVTAEAIPEIEETTSESKEVSEIAEATPAEKAEPKILLMPAKAEVIFVTTGGSELRADWSEAAQENLTNHLQNYISSIGHSTVSFDEEAEQSEEIEQLLLLADVVRGHAAINMPHKPKTSGNNLLSGNNRADLTLGENAALLRDAYGTDQVIFVDHYSQIESGGVFMAQVLIGAATGYIPASSNFRGTVATVVDLNTGEIVSRNFATMGDSRDLEESKGIVNRVMKKIDLQ